MFIFWIILVVLLYFVFQKNFAKQQNVEENCNAKEILKIRFAKGEIDLDTYLKMKETL